MSPASVIFSTYRGPVVLPYSGEIWKGLLRDKPMMPSIGSLIPVCDSIKKNSKFVTHAENKMQTVSVYSFPTSCADPYSLREDSSVNATASPVSRLGVIS